MSEFESFFTPDREPNFHVPYQYIRFNETKLDKKTNYTLEYDANLVSLNNATPLVKVLQKKFEDAGLDSNAVNEDDKPFNLRGSDPKKEKEYEGTEGEVVD